MLFKLCMIHKSLATIVAFVDFQRNRHLMPARIVMKVLKIKQCCCSMSEARPKNLNLASLMASRVVPMLEWTITTEKNIQEMLQTPTKMIIQLDQSRPIQRLPMFLSLKLIMDL